jgi:hypothetical protein
MRYATKVLVVLAAVFCLAAASPAFADVFTWSYTATTGTPDTAGGIFFANPTTPGQWLVTSVVGTYDGSPISLLAPGTCCFGPNNNNITYDPASPGYLDLGGVGFLANGGANWVNIYYGTGAGFGPYQDRISPSGVNNSVITSGGNFTLNFVHTPEPMTLGLLGTGLVGLFLAAKKKT